MNATKNLDAWMERGLDALESRGLIRNPGTRHRDTASSFSGTGGSHMIDLASNDYLGLARHPSVTEASIASIRGWGAGATSSRLVAGTTTQHLACEGDLARWCGAPAALVFSSGYLANLGVLGALGGQGSHIIADAHIHASLYDGARVAGTKLVTVPHNDLVAFDTELASVSAPRKLVLVESLYSVLGDMAPLPALLELCEKHDATLIVDEAHGLGVAGQGRGLVSEVGLAGHPRIILTATLSKALGSQGGVVLGSGLLREFLAQRARTFMFDTALAPCHADAARAALRVIRDEPERVQRLHQTAQRWRAAFNQADAASNQQGAIVSVPMPSVQVALAAQRFALERHTTIGVFRPPSTPDHVTRLRLTANAGLSDAQVQRASSLLEEISHLVNEGELA